MILTVRPTATLHWNNHSCRCALGKNGIVLENDKHEGDEATPAGIFYLKQVFYRADRLREAPVTGLPTTPLCAEDGWCDDPGDERYNRPVTHPYSASSEHLWRDDHVYDVIVVTSHNEACVPDKGSAIFIHIARPDYRPTEGCVALKQEDLLDLLKDCTPQTQLHILKN